MQPISNQQQHLDTRYGKLLVSLWQNDDIKQHIPIILLHDSLGSVGQWRDFPEILANELKRPVIAYDRLGFGQSAANPNKPSFSFIKEEAEQYFPLIKAALNIDKYHLLGHSVGGAMAINIAALDKDCQQVITLAAQAFVEAKTLEGIRIAQTAFKDPEQFEKLIKWHGNKTQWVLDAWTKVWLDPSFIDWNLNYCLKDVSCPVLAIHGEFDDYGSTAFPRYIAEHSQGPAEVLILAGCGHIPHKQKRAAVLQAIKQFTATP